MRADGMTCCSRHIPVVTVGLGSTERNEGGPHTDVVVVGIKVMTATRGLIELFGLLSGLQLLKNRGKKVETYTNLPCLTTEPLSPVPEVPNQNPKLGKMSLVDCG